MNTAIWFFIGYFLGCLMSMAAIHIGYRIAEQRAQRQETGSAR